MTSTPHCFRLRCKCGQPVGVVWFNAPATGSARSALYDAAEQRRQSVRNAQAYGTLAAEPGTVLGGHL